MPEELNPMAELGSSGLKRSGPYVEDEFLLELRGIRGRQVYTEMEQNEPIVGSSLLAISNVVRQVEWIVKPSPDDTSEQVSDLVASSMNDMSKSWDATMQSITTMFPFGFAPLEIVYKQRLGLEPGEDDAGNDLPPSKFDDGKVGWRKLALRAQDTIVEWIFDDNGGVQGAVQSAAPKWTRTPIPIEKMLLFRTSIGSDNPEGRSVLRTAYRPWYFKRRIEEIEAIGVERDLAGFPVVYMPEKWLSPNRKPAERTAAESLQDIVRNLRRNELEGASLPSVFDDNNNQLVKLELLSTGGSRQFSTSEIISRYAQHIAMTVLADWILMGHEKVGSFALAGTKTDMFTLALEAWLDSIAEVFNRHAIPRLLKLNGFDPRLSPTLVYGDVQKIPLETLVAAFRDAFGPGTLMLDPEAEDRLLAEILERIGLGERPS